MPLRKSPVRTVALLSANRANALKSTGPRTSRGKHSSALNALRHGRRAQLSTCWVPQAGREADAFWRFEARLREAILPLPGEGEHQVFCRALNLWITKRLYDRLAASADMDRRLHLALGLEPMPASYRMRVRRPGLSVPDWSVTISISMAWGRGVSRFQEFATELEQDLATGKAPGLRGGPGSHRARSGRTPKLPSLHTRLLLTTLGHPYSDEADERDGRAGSDSQGEARNSRTKPESIRKHKVSKNVPFSQRRKSGDRAIGGPADGQDGLPTDSEAEPISDLEADWQKDSAGLQTKPESSTKHGSSKNLPQTGGWAGSALSAARRLFR